jgi:hypothetical protein
MTTPANLDARMDVFWGWVQRKAKGRGSHGEGP